MAEKNEGLKAEARLLKRLQGLPENYRPVRVAASGAMVHKKADLKSDFTLIENKQTAAASFSLKRSIIEKIEREASEAGGRTPLLTIQMGPRDTDECRVVVMQERHYIELMDEIESWKQENFKMVEELQNGS